MTNLNVRLLAEHDCETIPALRSELKEAQDEVARLTDLATRWYLSDGTYLRLTEAQVIERRKKAARDMKQGHELMCTQQALLDSYRISDERQRTELYHWQHGEHPCTVCRRFDCKGHPCE
jgi:hypothetical protein